MILLFIMQQIFNARIVFIISVILSFSAVLAAAEDTEGAGEPGVLFINSNPINASVIVDGTPILQRTPALLRDVSAGDHEIIINKEGFTPAYLSLKTEAGKISTVTARLMDGTFIANFPGETEIILNTSENTDLPQHFRLSSGSFKLEKTDGRLIISPVYPKEQLFTVTTTIFAAAALANLISAGIELEQNKELFLPHSGHLIITESIAAVTGLAELALLLDKRHYMNNYRVYKADLNRLDSEAGTLFRQADNALRTGDIESALSGFSSVVTGFPDYTGTPEALYRAARLHLISGDTGLAAVELGILINQYPDPSFYDRACQTLALLYYNAGETEKSVRTVEKMVFIDPIFADAEKDIQTVGIEQVIENWAKNPERQGN